MKRFLTDIEIEDILYFIKPNKSIPLDCANSIVKITKDKFRKQLIKKEVYPSIIPDLKNIIHKNYQQSLIDAGESVGILAAQSIGERQTQNSIDYDEEIIINVENKIIKTKIGKFIDEYMESFSDCQKIDEHSYVQECKNVKIMTISQDEKIQWQNISEISRHYPKGNLVKVTTESGRSVVSTLSHSHLKKDKRTVVPVLGSELKLGDRIPVIKKSPVPNDIVKRIDITEYLEKYRIGPYEYDSDGNTPLNSPSNNNLEYVYLYGERFRRYIDIDNEFIDFLGIFIANGSLGYHKKQISLSSIGRYDQSIYEIIEKFCLKYDLQFNCNQLGIYFFQSFKNNRTTHYNINSRILYTFITRFLRKDGEKCIPDFIFGLDEDSMKLFLQSYFIEGGFDSEYDSINKDIQFLLTYFGIYSRIVNKKLVIQNQYNHLFYEIFNVKIKEENIEENFHTLDDSLLNKEVIRLQKLIDNIHEEVKITKYEELKNFIENFILESQKQCLTDIPENIEYLTQLDLADVVWEKITKLELIFEKDYKHKYVYDFSVKGNETFALFSGIVVHNTLNSVDWKEKIIYSKNDNIIVEPIGKMIDKLLLKNKENIENIEENRTEYLELKDDKYFIPSCDEYGNTNWYEIEAITKHLPVGKLVKVTTESGRTVMATQSKSFLVWNENEKKFLATAGSDIKIGDILPTTNLLPRLNIKKDDSINYNDIKIILNREIGFVIGLYLTGEIENFLIDEKIKFRLDKLFEHYNFNIYEFLDDITDSGTNIPSFSYNCSEEYIKGLLSGFFRNCEYKNGSILCSSYYEDIINGMLFLLNYYGVFGFFIKTEDEIIYKLEVKSDNTELLEKDVIEEIWKDISKEFMLSNYEISNLGRLKNKKTVYISIKKPDINGYIRKYFILDNNLKKDFSYHNLCICTFIEKKKLITDHINRKRNDNRISNLRFVSFRENNTNKIIKTIKGKKIEQCDLKGNLIKIWNKTIDASKELNISNQNISSTLKKKQKTAGNFIWKYHIEQLENEIWKKVNIDKIKENVYVSNFGRIKKNNDESTITYGNIKKNGYCEIRLSDKTFFVHRLIAMTFLNNYENKLYVNHKDGIKNNNNINNLEWVSHQENVIHYFNNNKAKNSLSKTVLQIYNDKVINSFDSLASAIKNTGIKGLKNCCYNKRRFAGGFKWKFEEKKIDKIISIKNNKMIYFDKVLVIEYFISTTDYVYDLTVKQTRNFQLFNGLNVRDTFHRAGQTEKSVTVGVNICLSNKKILLVYFYRQHIQIAGISCYVFNTNLFWKQFKGLS